MVVSQQCRQRQQVSCACLAFAAAASDAQHMMLLHPAVCVLQTGACQLHGVPWQWWWSPEQHHTCSVFVGLQPCCRCAVVSLAAVPSWALDRLLPACRESLQHTTTTAQPLPTYQSCCAGCPASTGAATAAPAARALSTRSASTTCTQHHLPQHPQRLTAVEAPPLTGPQTCNGRQCRRECRRMFPEARD